MSIRSKLLLDWLSHAMRKPCPYMDGCIFYTGSGIRTPSSSRRVARWLRVKISVRRP